jgi:hypothetical protein
LPVQGCSPFIADFHEAKIGDEASRMVGLGRDGAVLGGDADRKIVATILSGG